MKPFLTNRILLMALTTLITVCASAAPITREQARQRAEQFLQKRHGSRHLAPVTESKKLKPHSQLHPSQTQTALPLQGEQEEGLPLYYVFDRGTSEGFIIVSGDDQTRPVLGYTDHGTFDYAALPENARYWIDYLTDQLQTVRDNPQQTAPVADVPVHDAVEPLVKTKWNQGNPYNLACPNYFGQGLSVTGCVATAMAQLLYYWHEKSVTEIQDDIPAFDTRGAHATYGNLHVEGVPAGAEIDWDNMLEVYSGSATMRQKMAVANLMRYCGVAVRMDYSPSGSGAFSGDVPDALKNYFGYGSTVKLINRGDYTETTWDRAIYNEVAAGRPLYLSGSNADGGHAFVCDGYDGEGCFHINWGWGGGGPDGYYLLSVLKPGQQGIGGTGDGYSNGQAAVIGIKLDDYNESNITFSDATVRRIAAEQWDADGDGKVSHAEAAAVRDLGTVFAGQKIKNFLELYEFKGLREIADGAFEGCENLQNIRLPRHLQRIGDRAFKGCIKLKTAELPDEVTSLGADAFNGCAVLPQTNLPPALQSLGARALKGCAKVSRLTLPRSLQTVGDSAFADCSALTSVTVQCPAPQEVQMGTALFADIDLSTVALQVVEGTQDFYAASSEWSGFATVAQQHNRTGGRFADVITVDDTYYLYHVATGQYLTRGEAYSTQAVVGGQPMRFRIGQTTKMSEGVYYLYSDDTGNERHYLFRSTTDATVGSGVKAVFVDGTTVGNSASWQIAAVAPGIFTLQTPEGQSTHVEGEYLGIMPGHQSNAAYPTYAVYTDIPYAGHERDCQWRLVPYDEARVRHFETAQALAHLIDMAAERDITATTEQAVYDDFNSTIQQMEDALRHLRHKLGYMHFTDSVLQALCLENWDLDGDGELSDVETRGIQDFGTVFTQSKLQDFTDMQHFTGVTSLADNAFQRANQLQRTVLPASITTLGVRAFSRCTKLQEIVLPEYLKIIGNACFESCTALQTVTISVPDPADVALSANIFRSVDLANVTLVVPQGTRQLYAEADVWKDFGTIREMRSMVIPDFAEVAVNRQGYIYNLGARKFLSHGEAYDTQAVVDGEGIVYQFKRATGNNVYTLYSDQTGRDNKTLFRTDTDSKVGSGVKACFVDGTVTAKAFWHMQPVKGMENVFTLQVPANDETYVADEYLGVQPSHQSKAANPTYGLYWDVTLGSDPRFCYWAFIPKEDMAAIKELDAVATDLRRLLALADKAQVDASEEQAVYDDFQSTAEQLTEAIASLRHKLQLIVFQSEQAQKLCTDLWDQNEDDELSLAEAAAVKDIAQTFRNQNTIKSLDELRYFTAITEIPENAFRGCTALMSLYLPAGVTHIGTYAFTNDSKLKYMAVLAPEAVVTGADNAGVPKTLQVFVPETMVEAYAADETWGRGTVSTFTGVPTVTAEDQQRLPGKTNPKFTYVVTGAPINGTPSLSCEATTTSPVGTYTINVLPGTITSEGLVCVPGTLTVLDPDAVRDLQMVNGKWSNGKYYDLSGRQIVNGKSVNGKSVNGKLPRGVYIRGGKKMVR